ncbi:MAG: OmpA family protein [Bacteroidota bacterium]
MKNIKPFLLLLSLAFCGSLFSQNVEIKNLQDVNSEELDFSPMPFGNGIMYTSSKTDRFLTCPVWDDNNKGDYVDLYYAEKNSDGSWKEPVALKGKVNGKYNDGVPTFNPAGDKMIFTRNNLNGKNNKDVIDLKLYTGDFQDETWVNVTTPLPFNSDDWSTAHPTLSKDGKLLIFSSNRPIDIASYNPDSTTNMDLWGARWEGDHWSLPFNLGPSVNTDSNEVFPVLNENGTLFFSSNGHGGEGGLDIFAATLPEGAVDEWELVGNIGTPFNTSSDDMSFIALNDGTQGYFASDREAADGKGRDDIYEWNRSPAFIEAIIQVVDKQTRQPLPEADLTIDPGTLENESFIKYGPVLDMIFGGGEREEFVLEPLQLKTDENGKVQIRILSPATFAINASKAEYDPESRNPTDAELTEKPVYVIPLERAVTFAKLTVKVVENDVYGAPIPTPDIKVTNKRTGEVLIDRKGDNNGEANTQIDCADDYVISASKELYNDSTIILTDYEVECQDGEVTVIVPLRKPEIVILEPIFFSFDKSNIRPRDARPTLDNLATLMNEHESLKIKLNGNTDSRGNAEYNIGLSIRRAKSALAYLTGKGISKDRLSFTHSGEDNLANNCSDANATKCSEQDHQFNRRVDVEVEEHKEENIQFITRPVLEIKVISDRK